MRVDEISTRLGYPTAEDFLNGVYEATLLSKDDGKKLSSVKFFVSFLLMSEPPVELEESGKVLYMKYSNDVGYLMVTKKGRRLLVYKIGNKLCNEDGNCEEMETYYSCPQDCPLGSEDGVCIKKLDGACDPDCFSGVDPDCEKAEKRDVFRAILPYLGFLFVILILIILFFFYKKAKKKEEEEIRRKREEFQRWKEMKERVK